MNPSLLTECTGVNVPTVGLPSSPPHEVGDRFSPTDEELVDHYLKLKSLGKDDEVRKIPELDFYQFDPWELPYFSGTNLNRREAYFFSYLYAKHPGSNSGRINRSTKSGSWQVSGKDSEILGEGTRTRIGTKKIFVHSEKRDGIKFVMHEYSAASNSCEKGTLVLCKVMKKPIPTAKISDKKYKRSCRKTKIPSCDPSYNANSDFNGHDPNMNIDCSTHKEGESSSCMTFEIENKELNDVTCIESEAIHNESGYQNINTSIHNDDNTNHTMTFTPEKSVANVTIPKGIDSEILSHGDGLNYEEGPFAIGSFVVTEQGPSMQNEELNDATCIESEAIYNESGYQNINTSTHDDDNTNHTMTFPREKSVANVTIPKRIDSEILSHGNGLNYEDGPFAIDSFVFTEQGPSMQNEEPNDATCIESEAIYNESGYQNINTSTHDGDNTNHTMTFTPEKSVANVTIPKRIDSEILSYGDGLNLEDDTFVFDSFEFTEDDAFVFDSFEFTQQGPSLLDVSMPLFGEHPLCQSEGDEVDSYTTILDSVADVIIPKGISCEIAHGPPMCTEQSLSSLGTSLAIPGGNPSNIPEEDPFNVPASPRS